VEYSVRLSCRFMTRHRPVRSPIGIPGVRAPGRSVIISRWRRAAGCSLLVVLWPHGRRARVLRSARSRAGRDWRRPCVERFAKVQRKGSDVSKRELVQVSLTRDQAIVLSDWLDRVMHQKPFAQVVDDRAVWSPLLRISGSLEASLSEIFDSEYHERLSGARERLLVELGDFGLE
jgi:hypothetical protein